ncbi:MAG: right-handed parallel beta-helix repeat-containing protein (plasmid) [Dolichospermum sp. DET50]|nr:right-handed parallel beta-helix repeat-containing protein [Dolichospermum sp. DET66]MBS3035921.1 right-handed parallel beta-helix repeat-containing protein [Dolichospermum sp. DET67]MBS3041089.1 right-handed parallel beta-helix repeat-containing protein [Dolichospermum sp. DET50]QSX70972.1 MAG: right-handed parallel beta-helix repeat-containing protein [Dolichospermum sp. DET69]
MKKRLKICVYSTLLLFGGLLKPAVANDTATISPRFGVSYTTEGAGYNSFGSFEGFVPLFQTSGSNLTFLEGKLLWDTESTLGGNVVLGYRTYNRQSKRVLGGYVSYDIRDTGKSSFNQLGTGLESLGKIWDFRANAYVPIGDTQNQVSSNFLGTSQFGQNSLLLDRVRLFESAMTGFDMEAGGKLVALGSGDLRGYGGLYYYAGEGSDGVIGIKGRLVARPSDNFGLSLSVQNDSLFDTRVVLSVAANFPASRPRNVNSNDSLARIGESVERQAAITVNQRQQIDTVAAINPDTSNPYRFLQVNLGEGTGNGTVESPFGTVANALAVAQTNDIIYVQSGKNPGIPGFTIPNGVSVLSNSPVQILNTAQVSAVQLPLSGTGILPQVTETITLGNNNTISGFAIALNNATSNSAITGTNISNPTIRDNTITSLGGSGIQLNNVSGKAIIANNNLINSLNSGLTIDNRTGLVELLINNNQISNNSRFGINIGLTGDTVISTANITNNVIENNGSQGLRIATALTATTPIQFIPHTGKIQQLNISGNTVNSNNRDGIAIVGNSDIDNLTIANNKITNNARRGLTIPTGENAKINIFMEGNTLTGNAIDGIAFLPGINSQVFVNAKFNTITGNIETDFNAEVEGNANLILQLSDNKIGIFNTAIDEEGKACLRLNNNQIEALNLSNDNAPDSTLQVENTLPGNNTIGTISQNNITTVSSGACSLP